MAKKNLYEQLLTELQITPSLSPISTASSSELHRFMRAVTALIEKDRARIRQLERRLDENDALTKRVAHRTRGMDVFGPGSRSLKDILHSDFTNPAAKIRRKKIVARLKTSKE